MTTFDALYLSRGWLSVALASSTDKDRPMLHKTVCVETYDHGIRLVATDSYILLHAWIPELDHELEPEAAWDEAPERSTVAIDADGRGKSLMQYLYALATADAAPRYEMTMNPVKVRAGDGQGMFDGLAPDGIALEFPGVEKVTLGSFDGDYPNWRKTLAGTFRPRKTDAVALNCERIATLAKLGKLHGDRPLLWQFGGRDQMALVEVGDSEPHVGGAAMPVRWDFDRSMPADDLPPTNDPGSDE